jgi:hypothetical protein
MRGCRLAWHDASLGRWRSSVRIRPAPLVLQSESYNCICLHYTILMNRSLLMLSTALLILTITTTNISDAQNASTNASYPTGSLMDSVNQSTLELGQNASLALNEAGEKVGSTLNQLGQNMSDMGSEILNETEETARNVGIGAADVLSNISGEIKEGLSGK